jgi:hypothetical protein
MDDDKLLDLYADELDSEPAPVAPGQESLFEFEAPTAPLFPDPDPVERVGPPGTASHALGPVPPTPEGLRHVSSSGLGSAVEGTLFGDDADFHKHWSEWKGMPAYENENVQPHSSILVHFMTKADRDAFAKLMAQPVSPQTRSLFYPRLDWDKVADMRWKSYDKPADKARRDQGQTGAAYHGKGPQE